MNKLEELHLLPPQIQDNCKLALPEGLKDLMSDISREVLRYQPRNLCQFIADYLAALLVTRENLSVAGYICSDISDCGCDPELSRELGDIGFSEDEVKIARKIIVKYFANEPVNEGNLLLQLMKETNIDEEQIPAVQDAIRTAYVRHQANNTTVYESSSDSGKDEMKCAAKHTLALYRKTAPSEDTYGAMASKIQNSYRAYGVRRQSVSKDVLKPELVYSGFDATVDPKRTSVKTGSYDIDFPKATYSAETAESSWPEDPDLAISASMSKKRVTTISSTSLAGSFMNLPTYKPYSAHENEALSDLDEIPEKEHAYIDYTDEDPHFSMVTEDKIFLKRGSSKKISFSDSLPEKAKKMGLEVDNGSESEDSSGAHSIETVSDMFYVDSVVDYDGDLDNEHSEENFEPNEDADVLEVIRNDLLE